ncbi:hypothetical protein CRYUN_Cryun29cG0067200 [Craigia yunnanensis]
MSGVSLAVAPRSEPDQTIAPGEILGHKPFHQKQQQQSVVGGVMGSLRVIELQLVAFIMVFSVSGLVPLLDLVFPAFASTYIIALSRFAFPSHHRASTGSQEIFQGSKHFRLYVILGTTIGLFLPLAYVLGGFARGDNNAVRSAIPHLKCDKWAVFIFATREALVPLLYTVRRTFVILNWMHDVWLNKTLPANAQLKDIAWDWFGRGLAAANLLYVSINLLCFLIPRFLPRAFERYFRERDDVHGKMAKDKRPTAANKSQATDKKVD